MPSFPSHHINRLHHHVSRPRNFLVMTLALVGFMLLLGLMGRVVWNSLQKSQDIRQKAAGNAAVQLVEVTTSLDGGTTNLALNQDNTIRIRANTNGENTLGVQLKFCLTAPAGSQVSVDSLNPNLAGPPPSVNTTDSSCNGWNVFYAGAAISGFNTQSNSVDILKINVKPTQSGAVVINFNDTLSKSLVFNQVDVDSLKPIAPQTYTCPPPPESTPTPTQVLLPTATPTRIANCNCSPWALENPANPGNNICGANTATPVRCVRNCPAGCTQETASCLSYQACGLTPPADTPIPTSTTSEVRDDLFFKNCSLVNLDNAKVTVNIYEKNTKNLVLAQNIIVGTNYDFEYVVNLQNLIKTLNYFPTNNEYFDFELKVNEATSESVKYSQKLHYPLLSNHQDGAVYSISGSFVARQSNQFSGLIDPLKLITERNENNNSCVVNVTKTPPTPTLTPTPTGTKNWSEISANCNKSCTSNANCPNNMRCYNNQCRLADNPTATNCTYPADQGIARLCNEYCADSKECGGGLTCWFNRCRAPEAVDHTDCSMPSGVIARSMQISCNRTCSSNRDCSVNMRCYNNQCRLASNPTSASCAPAPRRVASAPGSTTVSKGGLSETAPTPDTSGNNQTDTTTNRYSAETQATPTLSADYTDGNLNTYQEGNKDDLIVTTAPLDSTTPPVYKLPSWSNPELPWHERLAALLRTPQAWIPIGVLGLGGILLVVALLAGRRKKTNIPPVSVTERTVPPANP